MNHSRINLTYQVTFHIYSIIFSVATYTLKQYELRKSRLRGRVKNNSSILIMLEKTGDGRRKLRSKKKRCVRVIIKL